MIFRNDEEYNAQVKILFQLLCIEELLWKLLTWPKGA